MEEINPLVEKILLQAKAQKKQANIFLILMLALFGCAVFLFIRLDTTNTELKIARQDDEQASGYKKDAERKGDEIKELKELLEECKRRLDQSDSLSSSIQQTLATTPTTTKVVYIHITGEPESEIAKKLLQKLKEEGLSVPGIQKVIDRKFRNRVFYFNDNDRPAAEDVEKFIKELISQSGRQIPKDLTVMKPGVEAPKGQIEVWLNLTD